MAGSYPFLCIGIAAMDNKRKNPLEMCLVNGARAWDEAHNSEIAGLFLGRMWGVRRQLCKACTENSLFLFSSFRVSGLEEHPQPKASKPNAFLGQNTYKELNLFHMLSPLPKRIRELCTHLSGKK
jgi:hypothetical protein